MRFKVSKLFLHLSFLAVVLFSFTACTVVEPGHRGVKITLGNVSDTPLPEGLQFHLPALTEVVQISVRQYSESMTDHCYSADLQTMPCKVRVLYSVPPQNVVIIYKEYQGNVYEALVGPWIREALKETTAQDSAENNVKNRDLISRKALSAAKAKAGTLLYIHDIVIEDLRLSPELEASIEAKMMEEQLISRAVFTQNRLTIEAESNIIKAKGEAEAMNIKGIALRDNLNLIQLQIAEKWDGKAPLVVGAGEGANILLPISDSSGK